MELDGLEWPVVYHYVTIVGDWFTTKYKLDKLDNEWEHHRVILFFNQDSPLEYKVLAEKFPLMDVHVANMEFHHQDFSA